LRLTLPSSHSSVAPPDLHSFPTRRSSDLLMQNSSRIAPYDEEPQAELELELLVLEGRAQLESGSLAFGEGGKEAQAALMTLGRADRKSTRLNSSHVKISYAVFCLKKKKKK